MCFVLYGLLIANYICMELYLFWPLFDSLKEAKHFKSKFLCIADVHTMKVVFRLDQLKWNTLYCLIYYINTNELPGELSRKNLISSRVKITCYLHMWKYHRCYGYRISHAFHPKKLLKWNGLAVHWCLYNK